MRHARGQTLRVLIERSGWGGGLLDQRGVVFGHALQLLDGSADLLDTGALLTPLAALVAALAKSPAARGLAINSSVVGYWFPKSRTGANKPKRTIAQMP